MEGCLHPNLEESASNSNWGTLAPVEIPRLLHLIFITLCVAMRYEPANAKFFQQVISGPSLCDTIRLLGWFDQRRTFDEPEGVADNSQQQGQGFHQVRHECRFFWNLNESIELFCREEEVKDKNRSLVNAILDTGHSTPVRSGRGFVRPGSDISRFLLRWWKNSVLFFFHSLSIFLHSINTIG